jgi:hypothetical protein
MNLRRMFIIGLFVVATMALSPAAQADLTIDGTFLMTDNRGPGGGTQEGYFLVIGGYVSPPPGVTATAQQISGGANTLALSYFSSPQFPNEYSTRVAYDTGLSGQWQIAANNGAETAYANTHVLDSPQLLPLAQNLAVSGSTGALTPTLTWTQFNTSIYHGYSGTPVEGSDSYRLMLRIRQPNYRSVWDSATFSTSSTSFTLPTGILATGQSYVMDLMMVQFEYESGQWYLENRSQTFAAYNSVPIPGAIWLLGTGLVALIGLRRRGRN